MVLYTTVCEYPGENDTKIFEFGMVGLAGHDKILLIFASDNICSEYLGIMHKSRCPAL